MRSVHRRNSPVGLHRALCRPLVPASALVALMLAADHASAQIASLESNCASAGGTGEACRTAADIVEIASARIMMIARGGNPVPGTASTLGYRVPGVPRIGLTARMSAGGIELPEAVSASTNTYTAIGVNLDATIGLIDGIPALATIGGIASVDLLTSIGVIVLPSADGFARNPVTWSAGARLGILRESFTAPGISLSAMYRRVGRTAYGADPAATGTRVEFDAQSAYVLTAVIGKRVGPLGLTAGGGYTRRSADVVIRVPGNAGPSVRATDDSFSGSRFDVFGNATWTMTVFGLVGEIGWQSSGDALTNGRTPATNASGGGLYFGLAARLTI